MAEVYTLANELFCSIEVYTSMAERATCLNYEEKVNVNPKNIMVERNEKLQRAGHYTGEGDP